MSRQWRSTRLGEPGSKGALKAFVAHNAKATRQCQFMTALQAAANPKKRRIESTGHLRSVCLDEQIPGCKSCRAKSAHAIIT